jgi:hypothetical protein
MAFVVIDGKVKASFLTACSNIAAPTTTELNAGTSLETKLAADGIDIGIKTGTADTSIIGSRYATGRAGRVSIDIMLKFLHDDTADTPWTVLTYGATGFLVVRHGLASTTAWASSQKVKVYPVEVGEFDDEESGESKRWGFSVPLILTGDPNQRAVIA